MGYGRSTAFFVVEENATFIGQPPYAINFKFDTSVWMEGMSDTEGFVVKI
jgi:hypothetical protein